MIYNKFYLHENEQDVTFEMFCCNKSEEYAVKKRPAILVLPGGGYEFCSEREAEPVVRYFMSKGYNCGILRYSVKEKASSLMPEASRPLLEASEAMSLIRKNAEEWCIDENKIAVLGFSAGGHLAGSLATLWNDEQITKFLDIEPGSNKPNAAILCYPVLVTDEYTHQGSVNALLGKYRNDENLLKKYDIPSQVGNHTPHTFLWNTYTDDGVPMENALRYALEMRKKSDSTCELHTFYMGAHGMSVCTKEVGTPDDHVGQWLELCAQWLEKVLK